MDGVLVIALDLNGTMIKWQKAFEQAYREAVREWLDRWSEEEEKEAAIAQMIGHYQTKRRQKYSKLHCIRSSLALLPFDAGRKTTAHLMEHINSLQQEHAEWVDGAENALEQLAPHYRLVIATHSTSEKVDKVFRQLDLQRFVKKHDIFTPDTIKYHKSNPAFYRTIASRLDLPNRQCAMVGNSHKNDIASASRAGWNTIWVHNKARRLSNKQQPRGRTMAQLASIHLLPKLFF
jgi:HAD superfamily hydrolase (TIGR01549 family)